MRHRVCFPTSKRITNLDALSCGLVGAGRLHFEISSAIIRLFRRYRSIPSSITCTRAPGLVGIFEKRDLATIYI